jgi:hypothetical protein
MIHTLLGSSWPVFLGLTLVLFGGCAWMMGQGLARSWKPRWHVGPYAALMAAADRFLAWGLFGETLLAPLGLAAAFVALAAIAALAWSVTRAGVMVRQYPWLYERAGLTGWRARAS